MWAGYLPDRGYFGFLLRKLVNQKLKDIPLEQRRQELDRMLEEIKREPGTVYVGTDAAKPEGKYQATCAALLYRQGVKIHTARHAAGKVLPSEAELHAIWLGLVFFFFFKSRFN